MKITPLYAESNTKFSKSFIFGTAFLVNKKNPVEREPYTSELDMNHLFKQGNDYLFLYKDKLFRIEGAKACELHFGKSTKNYSILMTYGNDEIVYFYSVSYSEVIIDSRKQINKNPVITELGQVKATNFEYFIYFFKKSITRYDTNGKLSFTMYDEEFAKESNPFFVLKSISQYLQECYEDFRLIPISDSKEAFLQNSSPEAMVTTFIKLTKDKMDSYDIVGNDFTILKNYVWQEYDIIDDWEWYQEPSWVTFYKDWILNGTQLINISEFLTYDIKHFTDKFKNPDVSLWKPNEDEVYVFFSDKAEENEKIKNGILWNLKKNTSYPNNVMVDNNLSCEPSLFWCWNPEGIPKVTLERNQDKNIYKIWYRESKFGEFMSIESHETPIAFYDDRGNHIYFIKNPDNDYMLIIDKSFNLISFRHSVSFFEEIDLYKRYPANLKRNINDEGKYFSDSDSHYFGTYSIIIVKEKWGNDVNFLVYFGYAFHNLNIKYSFKSYTFLPDNKERLEFLKIQIEGNSKFTEPQYIIVTSSNKFFKP